ncbi:MAG: replication initiation factor domain-containing protein [Hydrogenophaga sp.]|uniref:replication initiation factor domain-containing protein n=1 Tax=Hydrogenophaga sp. TaxID=1904254 RepID=UPI002637747B|nr:replication initiation factor domain-containing protein [Hydrogenophaga sp.]MCW5669386.1 replication initiation factor domain-containing protein [Hydrogenophaga sp.]
MDAIQEETTVSHEVLVAAGVMPPAPGSPPPRVQIDWLHITGQLSVAVVCRTLESILGEPVITRLGPGLMGYATRYALMVREGPKLITIGAFCEGEAQRAWNLLQLNAHGCGLLGTKWAGMLGWLMTVRVRITRIDLAVDFHQGEHDVDEGVELYKAGAFAVRGRQPKCSLAGDWLHGRDGRTFYVGRRPNGKLLRIYEKGRQLGDLKSLWVRWELQLGNKERDLPLGILIDPASFFAGAYPPLQKILQAAPINLPTRATERTADLSRRLHHLRASYGATLAETMGLAGATPEGVVDALRGPQPQARDPPTADGLTWAAVLALLNRRGG